jgi:dTDP-glucose pyrophosphorylase
VAEFVSDQRLHTRGASSGAGCGSLVDGVAGDGAAFGIEIRNVDQPSVLGSADAVARAVEAGATAPLIVCAADTLFRSGDIGLFVEQFAGSGCTGAIAARRDPPPGPGRPAIAVAGGLVREIGSNGPSGDLSGAPLWALAASVVQYLRCDRAPYELENSYRAAISAGERIAVIEIGKTRDLTDPLDLVEENFPYLAQ